MFPDDSQKELAAVLSYMAGRMLSREEICQALELPRSTYYSQLQKGTLITADNLRRAAANLRINGAELLTRYRFIDPADIVSLIEEAAGSPPSRPSPATMVDTNLEKTTGKKKKRAAVSRLRARDDGAAAVGVEAH
jgi:hypothetical protein